MRCTALSLNEIRTHLPRCHAQMPNSTMHLLQAFLSVGVLLRCRKDLSSGTRSFSILGPRVLDIFLGDLNECEACEIWKRSENDIGQIGIGLEQREEGDRESVSGSIFFFNWKVF